MVSEALLGEEFIVLDVVGHWAWGQLANDDYVGYVLASHLSPIESVPTHRIAVPSSFVFSDSRPEERDRSILCGSTRA